MSLNTTGSSFKNTLLTVNTFLEFTDAFYCWSFVIAGEQNTIKNVFVHHLVFSEYNTDASCHYKVELSYENLVVSGPNTHPPPTADDDSEDEDDEDVPRVSRAHHLIHNAPQNTFTIINQTHMDIH